MDTFKGPWSFRTLELALITPILGVTVGISSPNVHLSLCRESLSTGQKIFNKLHEESFAMDIFPKSIVFKFD
jgi:hypothetical protein